MGFEFYGDELNGVSYSDPATVKKYARRAALNPATGIFRLDMKDGRVKSLKSHGMYFS